MSNNIFKINSEDQLNSGLSDRDQNYSVAGQRLDNFLFARFRKTPKSYLYRLLRQKDIKVNSKRAKPDYRLQAGDEIRVPMRLCDEQVGLSNQEGTDNKTAGLSGPETATSRALLQIKNHIIYQDSQLIVLNKPAGLAVHGGSGLSFGVIELLRKLFPLEHNLELVHRLDKETSGCLLIAKKRSVLRNLHAVLRDKEIEKVYYALLTHVPPGQSDILVDRALQKNILQSGERMVFPVASHNTRKTSGSKTSTKITGQSAQTHFKYLEYFPKQQLALVEARPITGRTHQIRVHAQCLSQPIAGDLKYGDSDHNQFLKQSLGLNRLFLHAREIRCDQPKYDLNFHFIAPLDQKWKTVFSRLDYKI